MQIQRRSKTKRKVKALIAGIAAFFMLSAGLAIPVAAQGVAQVEGTAVPYPAAPATCNPGASGPVDYILAMPAGSGDLVGCLYGSVQSGAISPAGTVSQWTVETFIGCLDNRCGSFQLQAHITSKFEEAPPVGQLFGRCQHKIVAGSGTGDFEGLTGRLDFKDIISRNADGDVVGVVFDYRGHLSS
jgi:hypothetical protein